MDEFRRLAAPLLAGPPDPAITPGLLQGMAYLAAADKKWPEARTLTLRFARRVRQESRGAGRARDARRGGGAEPEWPIAREAYQILATRYPRGKRSARRRGSTRRRRCCAPAPSPRPASGSRPS